MLGKPIEVRPVPISSLEADGSFAVVWGQIFKIDSKEARDGGSVRYTVSISDGTGSVLVSARADYRRDKDKRALLAALTPGMCVILHPTVVSDQVKNGIFWGESYLVTETGYEKIMESSCELYVSGS